MTYIAVIGPLHPYPSHSSFSPLLFHLPPGHTTLPPGHLTSQPLLRRLFMLSQPKHQAWGGTTLQAPQCYFQVISFNYHIKPPPPQRLMLLLHTTSVQFLVLPLSDLSPLFHLFNKGFGNWVKLFWPSFPPDVPSTWTWIVFTTMWL